MKFIRISATQLLVIYLIAASKFLENNYITRDGAYKYKFTSEAMDCHYFAGNIEICIFKNGTKMISCGESKKVITKPDYVLVFKSSFEDPKLKGLVQKIRVYSNGIVIHSSKLFSYIYKLNGNSYQRREL